MSGEAIYLVIKSVTFSSDVIGLKTMYFLLVGLLSGNRTLINLYSDASIVVAK